MDSRRFDDFVRALGSGIDRRRLLRGLVGGATGLALAVKGSGVAGAAKGPCDRGFTLCGDECVFLGFDPNNCGACGTVCETGRCCNGQCITFDECPAGACKCKKTADPDCVCRV